MSVDLYEKFDFLKIGDALRDKRTIVSSAKNIETLNSEYKKCSEELEALCKQIRAEGSCDFESFMLGFVLGYGELFLLDTYQRRREALESKRFV